MSRFESPPRRLGLLARLTTILFAGAASLSNASAASAPDATLCPAPAVSWPLAGGDSTIPAALDNALRAYARGEIATACAWTALATKLLTAIPAPAADATPFPASNAGQLLEVLRLYGTFAQGTRPDLDAQCAAFVPELECIDALNHDATRPDHLGTQPVEYNLITHLVTRIGDLRIEYHLITRQIERLGAASLDYNLITHMPEKIGDIQVDYDLIGGCVSRIAGVEVH